MKKGGRPFPIFLAVLIMNSIVEEINQLKKRIANLEQKPQNDYLQKEDGMYMI